MAHLRIVCKWPEQPAMRSTSGPRIGLLPCIADTEVFVVRDDGTAELLHGVHSVSWEAKGNEVAVARITMAGEVHLEAPMLEQEIPTGKNPFGYALAERYDPGRGIPVDLGRYFR